MKKYFELAGAAAAVVLAGTVTASAATVLTDADISITEITFGVTDQENLLATSTNPVVLEFVTGSDLTAPDPTYRDVYEGTGVAGQAEYTAVQGRPEGASATYKFGRGYSTLEILWGSPDTWNWISFYLNGVKTATINGDALVDAGATRGSSAYFTTVYAGLFDTIVTESRDARNAFEYDGIAVVPLPAGIFLLGGALAGLGLARRRKS